MAYARLYLSFLFIFLASTLSAGELYRIPGIYPGEAVLTVDGMEVKLWNKTVHFKNGNQIYFGRNGEYIFIDGETGTAQKGTYEFFRNGRACAKFHNGRARCDHFVRSGPNMIMLIGSGERWFIQVIQSAKPGEEY
ncbi:MAG: hypothetical protein AAGF71_00720 [Pseudomonadota bacterium]